MTLTELTPEYVSRPDAAKFLHHSVNWLRREESLGRGPKRSRIGKKPVYKLSDLRAYIDERAEIATAVQ